MFYFLNLVVGNKMYWLYDFLCLSIGLKYFIKIGGTFLAAQWLRLHLPRQWVWVLSLVRELRSHKSSSVAKQRKKEMGRKKRNHLLSLIGAGGWEGGLQRHSWRGSASFAFPPEKIPVLSTFLLQLSGLGCKRILVWLTHASASPFTNEYLLNT